MQKSETETDIFPLSKIKSIFGTRRLVREKVLQILASHYVSDVDIRELFAHIFPRDFNIEPGSDELDTEDSPPKTEKIEPQKLLTRDEITEMLADTTIDWRKEDIEFGKQLLNECVRRYDFFVSMIKNISENWDFDRINVIDRTIIIIAASEMIGFPDIPIKATINEAIEMTKKYSTDKSYIFVNAVIEKIKKQLISENLIHKSEKGSR